MGVLGLKAAWWRGLKAADPQPDVDNPVATEQYVADNAGSDVSPAATDALGIVKLSNAPADADNPVAVETADARMSDARTPTAHTHPQSDITDLEDDLAEKVGNTGDETISGLKTFTDEIWTPAGINLNGGVLYDDTGNLSIDAESVTAGLIASNRLDSRQFIRPMEFVQGSKTTCTLFGAHTDSQTTLTITSAGSGTNANSVFANNFYPKVIVVRLGQADEEYIVLPTPPVNVASSRWQFSNVVRGRPFAGGTGQAHSSGAPIRETDNQNYMHGWCLPVRDNLDNYAPVTYMGQSDTNDAHDPIKVFLPPRIAIGTWAAPSLTTGENLSLFFVMRESATPHHVEIWEPYDDKKVVDFPSGTQAKYAEILHHAQTGTYIFHSIVGGDVA